MSGQQELFELPDPTTRPPGWQLVSGRNGPYGWHLIRQVHSGNSVTTNCDITGRVLRSNEREIVQCELCLLSDNLIPTPVFPPVPPTEDYITHTVDDMTVTVEAHGMMSGEPFHVEWGDGIGGNERASATGTTELHHRYAKNGTWGVQLSARTPGMTWKLDEVVKVPGPK